MISIDVVLKMEDCEKQMTMDEARNLYSELGRLFNAGGQPQARMAPPPLPPKTPPAPQRADPNEHPKVTEAREAAKKRTGGCGCGGNKKPAPTTEVTK